MLVWLENRIAFLYRHIGQMFQPAREFCHLSCEFVGASGNFLEQRDRAFQCISRGFRHRFVRGVENHAALDAEVIRGDLGRISRRDDNDVRQCNHVAVYEPDARMAYDGALAFSGKDEPLSHNNCLVRSSK